MSAFDGTTRVNVRTITYGGRTTVIETTYRTVWHAYHNADGTVRHYADEIGTERILESYESDANGNKLGHFVDRL